MKRNVFNCLLKEAREVAVVTLLGRLFHARAAITRENRSPVSSTFCISQWSGCFCTTLYMKDTVPLNRDNTERCSVGHRRVHLTHQSDKKVIEDEVNGDERCNAFTRLPHCTEHHFIPAFLSQDLKHRHHALVAPSSP